MKLHLRCRHLHRVRSAPGLLLGGEARIPTEERVGMTTAVVAAPAAGGDHRAEEDEAGVTGGAAEGEDRGRTGSQAVEGEGQ